MEVTEHTMHASVASDLAHVWRLLHAISMSRCGC